MAEKSITCDTFDRSELSFGPTIRISPDLSSNNGIPVMESCRHRKDFFGRYASPAGNYKIDFVALSYEDVRSRLED